MWGYYPKIRYWSILLHARAQSQRSCWLNWLLLSGLGLWSFIRPLAANCQASPGQKFQERPLGSGFLTTECPETHGPTAYWEDFDTVPPRPPKAGPYQYYMTLVKSYFFKVGLPNLFTTTPNAIVASRLHCWNLSGLPPRCRL